MAPTRILYVVTEDWYFLSHRLPMARAAKAAGYEIHVATRLNKGREAIEAEGFIPHALTWQRGSLSPTHSIAGVAELRKLLREIRPDILHNISLKPVLLGGIASIGLSSIAVVNSLTGLGTLFVGNHRKSELTRPLVVAALRALLKRQGSRTIVQNPDDKDSCSASACLREAWISSPAPASTRNISCRCPSRRRPSPWPMPGACSPTRA